MATSVSDIICEKVDDIILLVSEEDGSDTYYKLDPLTVNKLVRIHDKKFGFYANGISCDDNSVYMDADITTFLQKFRHGRYTSKWKDIAQLITVVEVLDLDARCLPYNYCVFLHH